MNEALTLLGENTWVAVWRKPDGELRVEVKWPALAALASLIAIPVLTFGITIGVLVR